MGLQKKIFPIFKTSASQEITYFSVLLFLVLTLPVLIAAATQPVVYKKSQAFDQKVLSTPLSTPSITTNYPPQFTTSRLPDGIMGRHYQATITATDKNTKDILAITIPQLSSSLTGLYLNKDSCRTTRTSSLTRLTCNFEGFFNSSKVRKDSPYRITFAVEDNQGARTQKQLLLTIQPVH